MPSQFQPYYPRPMPTAATAKQAVAAGAQSKSPINALLQAIGQQKQNAAAQQLMTDPDPDWLYTGAQPDAVAASPASYY